VLYKAVPTQDMSNPVNDDDLYTDMMHIQ